MSKPDYNWKRFWVPREGQLVLAGGGYLQDPDAEYGELTNPYAEPFASIDSSPCLVLLGEPGIGKSRAIRDALTSIQTRVDTSGGRVVFKDLNEYSSEDRLVREVFEGQEFVEWRRGSGRLHLILDSLDECLLRIDTVAHLFAQKLAGLPSDRLTVRIACRTAVWPGRLEEALKALWGKDNVGVYELAPLRRRDVALAASQEGLDPDAFLHTIDDRNVAPLAAKPITLLFLLNTFRRRGGFSQDQVGLYTDGCRLLCEEPSESRQAARRTGSLSTDQRLVVASRIAACMVFGNRAGIWTERDYGDVPEDYVTLRDLAGGTEVTNGSELQVTEAGIQEALDTGLFTSRGESHMGWAHQTYAEFLAADYCVLHKMTHAQLMGLLVHPEDPEGGLVPQLSGATAWIATFVREVFEDIGKRSPEVLLWSDLHAMDDSAREALVAVLLDAFESGRLRDRVGLTPQFRRLVHPGLSMQLRPHLTDSSRPQIVREVAVDIAEACGRTDLEEELVSIALDPGEVDHLRANAALAVARIGGEQAKLALKPIATGEIPGDANDELKGAVLQALWPGHIQLDELLAILTPPRERFIGLYWLFLSSRLAQGLRVEDLPAVLDWVAQHPNKEQRFQHPYEHAMDSIMVEAWDHLDAPGVAEAFARAALARLIERPEIVRHRYGIRQDEDALKKDPARRRVVITAIVSQLSKESVEMTRWIGYRSPLVLEEDLGWMAGQLRSADFEGLQRAWAALMRGAFSPENAEHLEIAYEASQSSPAAKLAFSWVFDPVELDSPKAEELKKWHRQPQEWDAERTQRPLLDPPPVERVRRLLDQFEQGDSSAWWKLNMEMMLEPDSTELRFDFELQPDLTLLPGWRDADEATKARLVAAARQYAQSYNPGPDDWIGTSTPNRPALAGYRTWRSLWQLDRAAVLATPTRVWTRWAPTLVAGRELMDRDSGQEAATGLLALAYKNAPEAVITTVMKLIDRENAEHGQLFCLPLLHDLWDGRLATALLDKLNDKRLAPDALGSLIGELLQHGEAAAGKYAASLIPGKVPARGPARAKIIAAARELLIHSADAAWPLVWPLLNRRGKIGREILAAVAVSREGRADALDRQLNEDRLAQLFLLMAHKFPYDADPRAEGRWVTRVDEVRDLRDSLLGVLRDKGTRESVDAIQWISGQLPELDWMDRTVHRARHNVLLKSWAPPRPSDILNLATSHEARYVQSGSQLLDVLEESLARLQSKLHGELTPVRALWDRVAPGRFRPVDEPDLSDRIVLHLREDLASQGIVINREVQIRRGQQSDLYIDAISHTPGAADDEVVAAIVEVKGCWNQELRRAMKTQLVDRYLNQNQTRHGMYLVGWFANPQWDPADRRALRCARSAPESLRAELDSQAGALSTNGLDVRAFVLDASYSPPPQRA